MIRLIYASQASRDLGKEDINQILAAARRNNLTQEISGMLCHGNKRFLQYLEGPEEAVNGIYNRILNDDRHKQIVIIDQSSLDRRVFGEWSMGFLDIRDILTGMTLQGLTQMDDFYPEKFNVMTAVQLIKNLKSNLNQQHIVE